MKAQQFEKEPTACSTWTFFDRESRSHRTAGFTGRYRTGMTPEEASEYARSRSSDLDVRAVSVLNHSSLWGFPLKERWVDGGKVELLRERLTRKVKDLLRVVTK